MTAIDPTSLTGTRVERHQREGARARWPWFGVAAGVFGIIATAVTDLHPVNDSANKNTPTLINELSRAKAHLSIVAGFVAVALLLMLAAAWRRRVEPRVPGSTAAHMVASALTASAAGLTLGYGWKGALAIYLPGGMDQTTSTAKACTSTTCSMTSAATSAGSASSSLPAPSPG